MKARCILDGGRPYPAAPTPEDRDRGFSVVELMVVILVMGLALMMSMPAFRTSLTGHRLRGTAEEFQSQLRLARSRAIAENVPFIASWNAGAGQLFLVRDDDLDGTPDWGTEEQWGPIKLRNGVTLANSPDNPFPGNDLVFFPDGSASASGTVMLTNEKGKKLYVDVLQPSGVVNVLSEDEYAQVVGP